MVLKGPTAAVAEPQAVIVNTLKGHRVPGLQDAPLSHVTAIKPDLIDELLVLTYREPDPEIDKAWAEEARDRLAAWRRGELKSRPAADVLAKHLKP